MKIEDRQRLKRFWLGKGLLFAVAISGLTVAGYGIFQIFLRVEIAKASPHIMVATTEAKCREVSIQAKDVEDIATAFMCNGRNMGKQFTAFL